MLQERNRELNQARAALLAMEATIHDKNLHIANLAVAEKELMVNAERQAEELRAIKKEPCQGDALSSDGFQDMCRDASACFGLFMFAFSNVSNFLCNENYNELYIYIYIFTYSNSKRPQELNTTTEYNN